MFACLFKLKYIKRVRTSKRRENFEKKNYKQQKHLRENLKLRYEESPVNQKTLDVCDY